MIEVQSHGFRIAYEPMKPGDDDVGELRAISDERKGAVLDSIAHHTGYVTVGISTDDNNPGHLGREVDRIRNGLAEQVPPRDSAVQYMADSGVLYAMITVDPIANDLPPVPIGRGLPPGALGDC